MSSVGASEGVERGSRRLLDRRSRALGQHLAVLDHLRVLDSIEAQLALGALVEVEAVEQGDAAIEEQRLDADGAPRGLPAGSTVTNQEWTALEPRSLDRLLHQGVRRERGDPGEAERAHQS